MNSIEVPAQIDAMVVGVDALRAIPVIVLRGDFGTPVEPSVFCTQANADVAVGCAG